MKFTFAFLLSFVFTTATYSQLTYFSDRDNNLFKIPCKVNDVPMEFIFDSGASDVSISLTEAMFLIKQKKLNVVDIIGKESYIIANGEIEEGTKVILRSVEIEGNIINNITATVTSSLNSPLLLGQNVISKLGLVKIQGNKMTIIPNTSKIYKGEVINQNKIKVKIGNEPITTLKNYLVTNSKDNQFKPEVRFYDIENSTIMEIKQYSGGSHCCNMTYLLYKYGDEYKTFYYNFGGEIDYLENEIEVDFYENIGYFFSCYNCSVENLPNELNCVYYLGYSYDKIKESKPKSYLNRMILENLQYLRENGNPEFNENGQDNGLRKEFASSMIMYFFNNNWNIELTAETFYKYYIWNDSEEIFKRIVEHIDSIDEISLATKEMIELLRKSIKK